MSADTVRPCSVMGYPPFPVALVHTQMLGGGARPGYAQKTRSLSLKVFSSYLRSLRTLRSRCWISAKFSASLLSVPLDFLLL